MFPFRKYNSTRFIGFVFIILVFVTVCLYYGSYTGVINMANPTTSFSGQVSIAQPKSLSLKSASSNQFESNLPPWKALPKDTWSETNSEINDQTCPSVYSARTNVNTVEEFSRFEFQAVGIKFIFGAISIFLALVWISGFNGSINDRLGRYSNLRIGSDPLYSDSDTLKLSRLAKSNDTRVDPEIQRNVIYERDDSRIFNFPRNTLNLNLRSYFRERDTRIEEDVFARNRRREQLLSRNFDTDRRQFEIHRVRKIFASPELERRERISKNIRYRLEKSPVDSFDRIRFDRRNVNREEFQNIERRRKFDRTERGYFGIEREIPLFRRQNRNLLSRRVDSRMDGVDQRTERDGEISRRRVIVRSIENSFKKIFQYIWDWGSMINSYLAGISSYLFTIIAGLFIFDTIGQFMPVKSTEEKGFSSLFRNFGSVTGNVMVH